MQVRRHNCIRNIVKVDRNGRLLQEINTFDSDLKIFHQLAVTVASFFVLLQLKDAISLHGFITLG